MGSGICRCGCIVIRNKVSQMAVFFFTNRCFQRNRFLRHTHNFPYFIYRHVQLVGNFIGSRFMSVGMQQLAGYFFYFVDGFYHMNRNTNGSCLVCYGTGNCLTNPPCCISRKFKSFGIVEFFYRFNQT